MYDQPIYVWAMVLIGVVGIPVATSIMLYRGALAVGLHGRPAVGVAVVTASVLGGWVLLSWLLARAGVYADAPGETTSWFGVAFAGALLALLLGTSIPVVSRILADPGTPARLAVPHTLRIVGVLFLIAMALGDLPAVFALPAGLGDIAVGIAAPFVARGSTTVRGYRAAMRFHVLGIIDLVVALTIGFMAGLGPFRPLDVGPTTEALALLPFALVPTTAVPLAITLHIVSLRRLRAAARETTAAMDTSSARMIRVGSSDPKQEGDEPMAGTVPPIERNQMVGDRGGGSKT